MNAVLDKLLAHLALSSIGSDRFIGQSQDLGWGTVFGGQVLGQGLSAAAQTVADDLHVHSLHAYFLRPGAVDESIEYEVDRIRDGRSFATRRVVALQSGRPIFNMAASFQVLERGFEHQTAPPEVPAPDSLLSERQLAQAVETSLPEKLRRRAVAQRAIERRPVRPRNPFEPAVEPPTRRVWCRATGTLPDDPAIHRYLLAYASDFSFLTTALQPHGVSWLSPGIRMASLDHAMWFHRPFRMDEWLLHVIESPSASGARGYVRGQFFTEDGQLVASTTQEGVVRMTQWRVNGDGEVR